MIKKYFAVEGAGLAVLAALAILCCRHATGQPAQQETVSTRIGTNRVSITISGGERVIKANGLPDHASGKFPRPHNPNSISTQNYQLKVPVSPVMAKTPIPAGHALFGIAVNGVPFDPATAEFWNNDMRSGWNYEANTGFLDLGLDQNNAHVQPSGAYHYHGLPTGLIARLARKHKVSTESASMLLIGWAADGFPIYNNYGHSSPLDASSPLKKLHSSYRVKHGDRPGGAEGPGGKYDGRFTADFEYVKGSGDLDECNGTYGVTPEFPRGTYYYAVTEEFPFISRFWRGEPDSSFFKRKPGPAGGRRGMRPRPGIRPSEGRAGEPGFGPQGPNQ